MLKLCGVSERKKRNEMFFVSRKVGAAKPPLRIRAERIVRHCELLKAVWQSVP